MELGATVEKLSKESGLWGNDLKQLVRILTMSVEKVMGNYM